MTTLDRDQHVAREKILKLLSDEENGKVSQAEGGKGLADGDEYVDLDQLGAGVQVATATMTKALIGHIVPRSALHDETWKKIVSQLAG
jgi:hypothetical protein